MLSRLCRGAVEVLSRLLSRLGPPSPWKKNRAHKLQKCSRRVGELFIMFLKDSSAERMMYCKDDGAILLHFYYNVDVRAQRLKNRQQDITFRPSNFHQVI